MTPVSFSGLGAFPKLLVSKNIHMGNDITQVNITLNFSGTIRFMIQADDNALEYVGTLTSGVMKSYTLTNSGSDIKYQIVGSSGAKLFNTYNDDLSFKAPAIKIEVIE